MARLKGLSKNLNAFLDMLGFSEGTTTHMLTKNDGYDVIVTGVDGAEIFTDYHTHPFVNRPPRQINTRGLASSASGRYQFLVKHWAHYRDLLKLPDFGPESQDKWAIQLIREAKGLALIEAGKFDEAVKAVRHLWASLPGAGYGQPEHTLSKLRTMYLSFGGSLWDYSKSAAQSLPGSSQSSLPPSLPNVPANQKEKPKQTPNTLSAMLNGLLMLIKSLFNGKPK